MKAYYAIYSNGSTGDFKSISARSHKQALFAARALLPHVRRGDAPPRVLEVSEARGNSRLRPTLTGAEAIR